jgi:hypothetical protein
VYRVFQLRELRPILRGRYQRDRLTVPTKMLFGVEDVVLRPELVASRAREFFAAN